MQEVALFQESLKVHFIDSELSAYEACSVLKMYRLVGLDIEGKNFGKDGMTISLIQFSISRNEVYIFDVLSLGACLFSTSMLLPILSNSSIIKLCYDCRCDSEVLFRVFGVQVFGLYDLQIVYTLLFQSRKDPYLKGFHKALQMAVIQKDTSSLPCNDIMNKGAKLEFIKTKHTVKQNWNSELVMQRPLSLDTLHYCACDVIYLFDMYYHWFFCSNDLIVYFTYQRMINYLYRSRENEEYKTMSKLDFFMNGYYLRHFSLLQNKHVFRNSLLCRNPIHMGCGQKPIKTKICGTKNAL